jgi:hypothetical protein
MFQRSHDLAHSHPAGIAKPVRAHDRPDATSLRIRQKPVIGLRTALAYGKPASTTRHDNGKFRNRLGDPLAPWKVD